jgi:hypothetical protein
MSNKITLNNGVTVESGVLANLLANNCVIEREDIEPIGFTIFDYVEVGNYRYENVVTRNVRPKLAIPFFMFRGASSEITENDSSATLNKEIYLSERDWEQYITDINSDEEPNDALKELVETYKGMFD